MTAMSPAASWGLLLLLLCVVIQAIAIWWLWSERRRRRDARARRPLANRFYKEDR